MDSTPAGAKRRESVEARAKRLAYNRAWYHRNKDRAREYSAVYRAKNAERVAAISSRWKAAHPEKRRVAYRAWYLRNKKRRQEYHRRYRRERVAVDPVFKLRIRVSSRVRLALLRRGWPKKGPTQEILGCDWQTAKAHLESKFQPNMTWENMGEWHIDHIVPLCSATTEAEVYKLCHYTNLQPLWAVDNLKKGGKHDSAASTTRT